MSLPPVDTTSNTNFIIKLHAEIDAPGIAQQNEHQERPPAAAPTRSARERTEAATHLIFLPTFQATQQQPQVTIINTNGGPIRQDRQETEEERTEREGVQNRALWSGVAAAIIGIGSYIAGGLSNHYSEVNDDYQKVKSIVIAGSASPRAIDIAKKRVLPILELNRNDAMHKLASVVVAIAGGLITLVAAAAINSPVGLGIGIVTFTVGTGSFIFFWSRGMDLPRRIQKILNDNPITPQRPLAQPQPTPTAPPVEQPVGEPDPDSSNTVEEGEEGENFYYPNAQPGEPNAQPGEPNAQPGEVFDI